MVNLGWIVISPTNDAIERKQDLSLSGMPIQNIKEQQKSDIIKYSLKKAIRYALESLVIIY